MTPLRKSIRFREIAARNYLRMLTLQEHLARTVESQRDVIKRIVAGQQPITEASDLCVYAHFDRDGIVDPYVLQSVTAYSEAGYAVTFVTNSGKLDEYSISRLKPICHEIIVRENKGYDFGAWKTGISRIRDLRSANSIILTNDSIYGPFFPIRDTLRRMSEKRVDFWGITESREYIGHLQSYFLFFEKSVITSKAFKKFWEGYPYYQNKLCVIWNGEIKLSRSLQRAGFVMKALCPSGELEEPDPPASGKHVIIGPSGKTNPTRVYWITLIEKFEAPFLKVDIVRDGIIAAEGEYGWRKIIASVSDYDIEIVQNHFNRMRGIRS